MSAGNRKNLYRPVRTPVQERNGRFLYILVLIVMACLLVGLILR